MIRNDRQKMIEFISRQLPDGEASLLLASGPGGNVTANVTVQADDLEITSNCPEWTTIREVYEHLRWKAMPRWEQQEWQRATHRNSTNSPQFRLETVTNRLQELLFGLEVIQKQQECRADSCQLNTVTNFPEQSLTIRDVAALLGCSYSEARDRMLDGRIQAIRDGRWLRTRREWVEEYVAKKLVKAASATPEIHTVRVRKPRKGQVAFTKGGMGYQFLKERQQNQK